MNLKQACNAHDDILRIFGFDFARFFCGFGFAFMCTSMTCSKLKEWSETGVALFPFRQETLLFEFFEVGS
jgi:hypothetical protein